MEKPIPKCRHCNTDLQADLDFPFGRTSSVIIKTFRCPKCLWVCMVHSADDLEIWEKLERFERKTKKQDVGEDWEYVHNYRGMPSTIKPSKHGCGGDCGDDCSCNSQPSGGCGGSCGGCKH